MTRETHKARHEGCDYVTLAQHHALLAAFDTAQDRTRDRRTFGAIQPARARGGSGDGAGGGRTRRTPGRPCHGGVFVCVSACHRPLAPPERTSCPIEPSLTDGAGR